MTIDPICGMTVDETTAASARRGDVTFYFCSEHCRLKFLSSETTGNCCEAKDHNDHGAVTPSTNAKYYCPMCPGVELDKPGECPKCGMALEPASVAADEDEEENGELHDMTRRFQIAATLTLPVFLLAMAHLVPALAHQPWADTCLSTARCQACARAWKDGSAATITGGLMRSSAT